MKNLWQDLRYGARMLMKTPGFTLIAVLTIALGIGINTAIFSVVDAVVWRPLPFKQPDRLVMLWTNLTHGGFLNSMRADSWLEWRDQSQLFAQVEAYVDKQFIATGGPEPVSLSASAVSPDLLTMLGAAPQLGRGMQASDAEPGNDRNLPIGRLETAEQMLAVSLTEPRYYLLLMALFAGCAILRAAVGLYGVLSYLVTQRTSEIGLRMALGAQTRNVLRMVLQQGMALALLGTVIGIAAAAALTRWLKSLLFEVSATDPLTYAAITVLLCGVALLACWIPARRAAKVDPMIALRCE